MMERMAMVLSVPSSLSKFVDLATRASPTPVAPLYPSRSRTSSRTSSFKPHLGLSYHHPRLSSFSANCSKQGDNNSESTSENLGSSPNSWQHDSHGEETLGRNADSPHSSSSSSHPTTSQAAAASSQHGRELDSLRRENSELRTALAALSQSLASISASLNDVSRAVQLVANAVECGPSSGGLPQIPPLSHPAVDSSMAPVEFTNGQVSAEVSSQEEAGVPIVEDPVQAQLFEQNMKAHKLAYRLQQAFVQARIEGLGKPFQLAAEDFVTTCLEAHAAGIGLKELQLQLILLEGGLTGAFAIRNQRYSDNPVMGEESRVRSSWVRLVYTTLAEVKERRSRVDNVAGVSGEDKVQSDPSDMFVKELIRLAYEDGYDLERLKLEQVLSQVRPQGIARKLRTPEEQGLSAPSVCHGSHINSEMQCQSVAGPPTSASVKTMRESTYLILLTLQKVTNNTIQS